ncbi:hypothetical protein ABID81_002628 [Frigoribacterium sp. PvP054]|uniref:DUF3060 domain-containing protein n=1 Tax=Frigoribacterium sp. PvP054 TaxID=3156438 RepID=UPI003394AEF6
MTTKPLLATALAGLALLGALTGCTSTPDTADPLPTPTGQPDNECVDGIAYLQFTETDTDLSLPEGCSTVIVLGDGGTATLGPVDDLSVMGDGNTVTLDSVHRIDPTGNDNTITYGGDAPEILGDDTTNGTGNTITAG